MRSFTCGYLGRWMTSRVASWLIRCLIYPFLSFLACLMSFLSVFFHICPTPLLFCLSAFLIQRLLCLSSLPIYFSTRLFYPGLPAFLLPFLPAFLSTRCSLPLAFPLSPCPSSSPREVRARRPRAAPHVFGVRSTWLFTVDFLALFLSCNYEREDFELWRVGSGGGGGGVCWGGIVRVCVCSCVVC